MSLSHLVFLMAGMGVMTVVGVVLPSIGWVHVSLGSKPEAIPSKPAAPSFAVMRANEGPWGSLQYTRFALEEPADYLPDSTRRLATVPWVFEKFTARRVEELFRSVNVTEAVRQRLLDRAHWQVSSSGVTVQPSMESLRDLGAPARQQIYAILDDTESNYVHRNPFRFRLDGFDEWFANSELTDEHLDLLRSLSFTNLGGAICIVDLDVLQQTFTTNEFRRVFESLYSEPCLLMDLQVSAASDVEALAKYWGRGGREATILPVLRSLARRPGGGSVNIAQLLPPFAQSRLYTFSPPTTNAPTSGPDCFWTAMNFFNTHPDPGLSNFQYALDVLNRDYSDASGPKRFGDLLLLLDERRQTIHACVYVADDVVFTKNGADYLQPWTLMKIPDMLAHYATDQRLTLVTLRPRKT